MKAGAHAAWIVPAVQVVGAAPAFANCSGPGAHVHNFTFVKVSASWAEQGKNSGKFVLTIVYRITDSDPCPMPGLVVQLTAPDSWGGIQDHSTAPEYGATKVGSGTSSTWSFTPVLLSPGVWTVEMKIQASDSARKRGRMTLVASLDGYSESTTFNV